MDIPNKRSCYMCGAEMKRCFSNIFKPLNA